MIRAEQILSKIPEKVIKEISNNIGCGMVCIVNLDTWELNTMFGNGWCCGDEDEFNAEVEKEIEEWEHTFSIEPLDSHESYRIMECFVGQCIAEDSEELQHLFRILDGRKPFSKFKYIIESGRHRQEWFDFRQKKQEEYVRKCFLASEYLADAINA